MKDTDILFSIAFYNFNCGLVICPERVYTINDTNRKRFVIVCKLRV